MMIIRPERPGDEAVISSIVAEAFASAEHSDGTEAAIVERLRVSGGLTLSLVVEIDGAIVGHLAFSPVTIDGRDLDWLGLGPVAVAPAHQRQGIGAALVEDGLGRVRSLGPKGCVVLGDPSYYGRFGFKADPRLSYPGLPPEYFQALLFDGDLPTGTVAYHPAFG